MDSVGKEIARHKTAIRRYDLSLPVKCLIRDGLLALTNGLFDFGCGHGENIELLRSQGIACAGWDPAFRANEALFEADVVNLGYVINVIEDVEERAATLKQAWHLTRRLMAVSAQIQVGGRGNSHVTFGDGIVTQLGTFQKFYTQSELREYLELQLGVDAIPAALGGLARPQMKFSFKRGTLR